MAKAKKAVAGKKLRHPAKVAVVQNLPKSVSLYCTAPGCGKEYDPDTALEIQSKYCLECRAEIRAFKEAREAAEALQKQRLAEEKAAAVKAKGRNCRKCKEPMPAGHRGAICPTCRVPEGASKMRYAGKAKVITNSEPLTEYEQLVRQLVRSPDTKRPTTRGECRGYSRPCPYISCRHHLYLEVNPVTGSLKIMFPGLPIDEALLNMPETCSLDLAEERQGMTIDDVEDVMNISRGRVQQIEKKALANPEVRAHFDEEEGVKRSLNRESRQREEEEKK